jgi:uncharacterized protein YbjQ (UPF0145 family)
LHYETGTQTGKLENALRRAKRAALRELGSSTYSYLADYVIGRTIMKLKGGLDEQEQKQKIKAERGAWPTMLG